MMRMRHETGFHEPVMVQEVVSFLVARRNGVIVDGTLGGGGHSEHILQRLQSGGRLIGIDRDAEAVATSRQRLGHDHRITIVQGAHGAIDAILNQLGVSQIDGLLLDLGVSSFQIDSRERGFSYQMDDTPLDMRMDSELAVTAEDILLHYSDQRLADLFFYYGEERRSRQIARRVVAARKMAPLRFAGDLMRIIRQATPPAHRIKTLARIWQALRIEVNDELGQLCDALVKGYRLLTPGGRMVVLCYESLSDRMVKRFFRGEEPTYEKETPMQPFARYAMTPLTRRVMRPDPDEVKRNSRARSARLRAGEKEEEKQ